MMAFIMFLYPIYAQELAKSEINALLDLQGEVTFNFKVDNNAQLSDFTHYLTIINYDYATKQVKAWANQAQFKKFINTDISYRVYKEDNDINKRLMSSDIDPLSKQLKQGYTLEFPLKAYPTYQDYAMQMQNFENEHSDIVDYFSIGTTEQGDKEILFVKISDNVTTNELEPKLLYTSTMHGDEIAGFPLMLNLIDYFITAYKDKSHPDHKKISKLINESEIWINPNANPDGTYHLSVDNTSVTFARRGNYNNIDLNRNYPDNIAGLHPDGEKHQLETKHFMKLAFDNQFVIAANFHGGSELVNYPWDNTFERHADDSWWKLTAGEYRKYAQNHSPFGYMDDKNNGITNGADWYLIHGSRQDYMNSKHQCKELTVELSETKKPFANQLTALWRYNKVALTNYLIQGTYGFRGIIKDAQTNLPIQNAQIKAIDHDSNGSWALTDRNGSFYRPIYSGAYDLIIEAPNYKPILLPRMLIDNYETKSLGSIKLLPALPKEDALLTLNEASLQSNTLKNKFSFKTYNLESNSSELTWINLVKNIDLFR